MKVKLKETGIAVTKKNFDKAITAILGKNFKDILSNPITQLEKSIYIAFVEQPERKDENLKKYVKLLRELAKRLRKHGQFVWDKD